MARFGRRFPVPSKYVWTNTVQTTTPASIPQRCIAQLAVKRSVASRLRTGTHVWTNTVQAPTGAIVPQRSLAVLARRTAVTVAKRKRQTAYVWTNTVVAVTPSQIVARRLVMCSTVKYRSIKYKPGAHVQVVMAKYSTSNLFTISIQTGGSLGVGIMTGGRM